MKRSAQWQALKFARTAWFWHSSLTFMDEAFRAIYEQGIGGIDGSPQAVWKARLDLLRRIPAMVDRFTHSAGGNYVEQRHPDFLSAMRQYAEDASELARSIEGNDLAGAVMSALRFGRGFWHTSQFSMLPELTKLSRIRKGAKRGAAMRAKSATATPAQARQALTDVMVRNPWLKKTEAEEQAGARLGISGRTLRRRLAK